jgi:hypothetical protein
VRTAIRFRGYHFVFKEFGGFYADDLPFSRDFACAWIVSCVRAAAPGNRRRNNRTSAVDSGPAFCFRYRGSAEVRSGRSHGWSKRADRHGSKRLPGCTAGQSRRQCAPDDFGSRIERGRRRRHFDENGQGSAVRGGRSGDRRIYHLCRDTRWGFEPKETLARAAVDRTTARPITAGLQRGTGRTRRAKPNRDTGRAVLDTAHRKSLAENPKSSAGDDKTCICDMS